MFVQTYYFSQVLRWWSRDVLAAKVTTLWQLLMQGNGLDQTGWVELQFSKKYDSHTAENAA